VRCHCEAPSASNASEGAVAIPISVVIPCFLPYPLSSAPSLRSPRYARGRLDDFVAYWEGNGIRLIRCRSGRRPHHSTSAAVTLSAAKGPKRRIQYKQLACRQHHAVTTLGLSGGAECVRQLGNIVCGCALRVYPFRSSGRLGPTALSVTAAFQRGAAFGRNHGSFSSVIARPRRGRSNLNRYPCHED